jgi:hypothetical protein
MKPNYGKQDDFTAPARRAFRRVARQLRAESAKFGTPLVFGENGKVRLAYFTLDKDRALGKLIFNRTITVKNTWTKEAQNNK